MRYVLDASVAIASLRPNEPSHAAAVAFLTPLLKGVDAIPARGVSLRLMHHADRARTAALASLLMAGISGVPSHCMAATAGGGSRRDSA
jgi:hypothetical protein